MTKGLTDVYLIKTHVTVEEWSMDDKGRWWVRRSMKIQLGWKSGWSRGRWTLKLPQEVNRPPPEGARLSPRRKARLPKYPAVTGPRHDLEETEHVG